MEKEEVEVAAIIIIEVREDSEVIEEIEEEEEIEEIEEVEDKEEVTEIMNKVEEEEIAKVMDNKKRNHMSIRIQVKLLQIKYKSSKRLSNKKRVFLYLFRTL
jgi:3-polyprenyl-4-hydroxybenzoate decarboxylase